MSGLGLIFDTNWKAHPWYAMLNYTMIVRVYWIRVWMPGSFSLIMVKFLFFSVHVGLRYTVACRLNCIKCEDTIFYLFFIKSRFGKPYIALIQEFFICLFHFQDFMYSLYFRNLIYTTATCFIFSPFPLFCFRFSRFFFI